MQSQTVIFPCYSKTPVWELTAITKTRKQLEMERSLQSFIIPIMLVSYINVLSLSGQAAELIIQYTGNALTGSDRLLPVSFLFYMGFATDSIRLDFSSVNYTSNCSTHMLNFRSLSLVLHLVTNEECLFGFSQSRYYDDEKDIKW